MGGPSFSAAEDQRGLQNYGKNFPPSFGSLVDGFGFASSQPGGSDGSIRRSENQHSVDPVSITSRLAQDVSSTSFDPVTIDEGFSWLDFVDDIETHAGTQALEQQEDLSPNSVRNQYGEDLWNGGEPTL